MASLISFLKSTVLTVSDSLNAKTSGALQQTETGIQAVEDIFTKLFSSLLNSGNANTAPPITTLTLTPEENTQVAFDQAIVSTVVNPTEVLLTRAPYTFATAPNVVLVELITVVLTLALLVVPFGKLMAVIFISVNFVDTDTVTSSNRVFCPIFTTVVSAITANCCIVTACKLIPLTDKPGGIVILSPYCPGNI